MTGEVSGERLIGYLPCTSENRKFRLENQMVRAILLGPLGRVQKIIYRLWFVAMHFFFKIFLGFSAHLDVTCSQPFSHHVKFYSFMFVNKIPTRLVCVNGKPSL